MDDRFKMLAKKYDLKFIEDNEKIEIKPKFNLLKKADIGLILMIVIPLTFIYLILDRMNEIDFLMLIFVGLLSMLSIVSILTIFKSFNDKLIISKNKIEFINSLKKRSIKLTPNLRFKLETENIKIKLKYTTSYHTIIDIYVINNNAKYRFLDFSSDLKNSIELIELGNLIIRKIEKVCNTIYSK